MSNGDHVRCGCGTIFPPNASSDLRALSRDANCKLPDAGGHRDIPRRSAGSTDARQRATGQPTSGMPSPRQIFRASAFEISV